MRIWYQHQGPPDEYRGTRRDSPCGCRVFHRWRASRRVRRGRLQRLDGIGQASSNYAAFNGPATLYVLRTMPVGIACELTSSNARAGVPSAKKRFPVPSRAG